jgi:D-sedoheptulose 7-phosphate isomerase
MTADHRSFFDEELEEHGVVLDAMRHSRRAPFAATVGAWSETIRGGGRILFFGNGGSAADAQHLATGLTVRYRHDRKAIAAVALASDSSALTAAANDLGLEQVFARQIEAIGQRATSRWGFRRRAVAGTSSLPLPGHT